MVENSKLQADLEKKAKTSSEIIYKGKIITLKKDIFQIEGKLPHQFDIIIHPGAVAMVPVNEKGNLLLVKQWRRAIEKIIIEIPAGTLEENEDPLECAQRELQEEIGYKAETFISLGGYYNAPGYSSEYLHIYIAKDLKPSPLVGDDLEYIDIVEMSLDQALSLIDEHKIEDAKTIASILHYSRWKSHEKKG